MTDAEQIEEIEKLLTTPVSLEECLRAQIDLLHLHLPWLLDRLKQADDERTRILSALGEHPDSQVCIEDEIGRLRHDSRLLCEANHRAAEKWRAWLNATYATPQTETELAIHTDGMELADEIEKGTP